MSPEEIQRLNERLESAALADRLKHAVKRANTATERIKQLETELAEARKDGERWEHRYRYLRKITEAALPENMGGYPDLFYPEGFPGDDDSANPWELWESAVKIEAKHVDAAVAERAARGAK